MIQHVVKLIKSCNHELSKIKNTAFRFMQDVIAWSQITITKVSFS